MREMYYFCPTKKIKKKRNKKYENEPEKTSLPENNLIKAKSMRELKNIRETTIFTI